MEIQEVSASNFRTFEELNVELGDMDILIGANASGKSNFLDLIEFISDLTEYGLEDAVYLQGGMDEVKNRGSSDNKVKLSFEAGNFDLNDFSTIPAPIKMDDDTIVAFNMRSMTYSLEVEMDEEDYRVIEERTEFVYDIIKARRDSEEKEVMDTQAKIVVTREEDVLDYEVEYPDLDMSKKDIKEQMIPTTILKQLEGSELGKKEVIFDSDFGLLFNSAYSELSQIRIYDIEPGRVKTETRVSGKKELESNGENLSVVLDDIGKDQEKREKFNTYSKQLLPFVDGFKVEKNEGRSFVLKLVENFFGDKEDEQSQSIASMISDGTINVYSMIVAMFFEEKKVIGLEEPGTYIHPSLVSKLVRLIEEASLDKQILATTHNPDFLRNVDNENILLVRRNNEGFTEINRPQDDEVVSTFLENEVGLEELHKDNIMG